MKKHVVSIIVIHILIVMSVYGQNSDLVMYYDNELVKVNYQSFGGITLSYQGQTTGTSMGITPRFRQILSEFPDTKILVDNYVKKNTIGNVLIWGGLAASLGAAYYPTLKTNSEDIFTDFWENYQTSVYMILGGLVAEIIGSFVLPQSFQDLFNATNQYNRNKLKEY